MRILFTGVSSFTGSWFARALADAGHEVVAPLRGPLASYSDGLKAARLEKLGTSVELVPGCVFGEDGFMALARERRFDVFCHHAAQVTNYRSPDFDIVGALANNTLNLRAILDALKSNGTSGVVLTGSVFEQTEGAGEKPLRAFSPYGLSKGLTAEVFSYRCQELGLPLSKFVIPNPFGPLEEPRFCAYLVRAWKAGQVAKVNTPAYVRDNIHIDLLAKSYVKYVGEVGAGHALTKLSPSGYVETQGAFAERFAREMRSRLGMACDVDLAEQSDFGEPLMRVNTDSATLYVSGWKEAEAWDGVAAYYR
ncbi:NAD-dependent epimerase/dehydratase family protein [Bosea rubneri]|uniref:NAD(P)-dependent oxidoreductase n=1 Tax=Bosea rubneri TaxID=3075434 RepID=A0ABU3SHA4_9HYPH|nr:NAD(P)-dependent oxidoreductase [Bosea sp. ZW T0_25]MDU0343770.1 NAD(P)-dependent oxidoreductase [Bosea sp. ZW T0_25]